ncbi:hypothetical protein KACC15558_08450 [Brevibacterium ammoniilyticum]|uniref:Uncharacterized protein n=1 Tax=Brevibacterium ammoniilyticum TaxID=1046555 RepID=A0ABP9TX17_9MICO
MNYTRVVYVTESTLRLGESLNRPPPCVVPRRTRSPGSGLRTLQYTAIRIAVYCMPDNQAETEEAQHHGRCA